MPSPTPAAAIDYLVTFKKGTSAEEQAAALDSAGAVVRSAVPELRLAMVQLAWPSAVAAAALAADPAVLSVERDLSRDVEAVPSDLRYAEQWSLPRIGWDTLQAQGLPSGKAIVAILDTGVDASQPDLQGRLLPGLSFVDGSPPDTDPHGHGTAMAGIVAAATDNAVGIAGIGGAGVRVLPITVLGADGTGQDSAVIQGIVAAVDAGADVILMAFSNPGYSDALQAAVDYAWKSDVVLVAANGNDGVTTKTYPAGDHEVMGIASTDRTDALAVDSNHGQQTFLAAPGVDILTTAANAGTDPLSEDQYRSISGTSAAAAEVAGAAAVLRALDGDASNAVIVGRLARSAAPIGTQAETGNGRLDLARAAADTGTDPVTPVGVPGSAAGGPFVGPYVAAAGIFTSVNIGTCSPAGTSSFLTPTYTEVGCGADIWGAGDQFHFDYLVLTGDGRVTAKILTLTGPNADAKAGVMFRETTASASQHAMMGFRYAGSDQWFYRNGTTGTGGSSAVLTLPVWVRLTRIGNVFTGETAPDVSGVPGTWTVRGTQTIAMASSIDVGLATNAHAAGTNTTATYSNVTVSTPPTALSDVATVSEDGSLTIAAPGVLYNDTDPQGAVLTVATPRPVSGPSNGVLTLNADGSGTYTPNANFNGTDSFTYKANDGIFDSATAATVTITVTAVNDAPVNSVPGAQSAYTSTAKVFSSVNGNLISIADDATSGSQQIQLAGSNGTLSLSGVAGLTFTVGDGTADAAMTFTGTIAAVNTALAGLSFNPTAGFDGTASLQIITNDQGNTGTGGALSDTDSVSIAVAPDIAPIAVADSYAGGVEDTLLTVATGSGVLANDTDAGADPLTALLVSDVANGDLNFNADGSFTYLPGGGFNGSDSFTYKANDGQLDSNVVTVTITVAAVNDAPVNTVPGPQSTSKNVTEVFSVANNSLIAVSDLDAGAASVQVQLTGTSGTVSLSGTGGLTFTVGDGTTDATMTFSGTIANVNLRLAGLSFIPTANFTGAATLQIVTSDLGNSGSGGAQTDTDTVTVTVYSLGIFTTSQDIGTVGIAGSTSFLTSTYTVKGAGADIWGAADAFQFVYRSMTGNGQLTAKVLTVPGPNTNAKAGVMIRDGVSATSMDVLVDIEPSGAESIYRASAGGSAVTNGSVNAVPRAPYWVRVSRVGNAFSTYTSADGVSWAQLGTTQTIGMSTTFNVGLVVSSHVAGTLMTSTFDNVSFDTTAPTADFATPNEGTTTLQSATAFAVAWTESDGTGIGVNTRSLQRWKGSPSAPGSCAATSWATDGAAVSTVSSVVQSGLATGTCYRWVQTLTDYAGNAAGSASGSVLIDTSAPSQPNVTGSGTNVYQAGANNPIYFKSGASGGPLNLSSISNDPESGVTKHNYGALTAPTGWTYTAGDVATNPAAKSATWGTTAGTTNVTLTPTNGALTAGAARIVALTADGVAPAVGGFTPGANALLAVASVTPTWTETEAGSGVASRSLQRKTGAASPAASCATTSWADDGAAVNVASGVAQAGLTSGSCYEWTLTLTDNVGNTSGPSTSSWVLIDTSPPSAPSVTATGSNVYQAIANGTVFFKPGATGSINLVATAADTQSGLANIIFASPSVATGWSGTPVFPNTDAGSPYSQADNWASTAGSGTQAVTATNGAGGTTATSLVLTVDGTAPTLVYTIPAAGTTIQTATSVNVTWGETETDSGVVGRSLQRMKGSVVTPGSCVGVVYANDGAADTGASPRSNTSLVNAQCYQWLQTLTDRVGNVGVATTSGAVLINGAPTAVADAYTTAEDVPLAVPVTGSPYNGVLFNDSDPGNDALTAVLVANATHGILTLNANGSFGYAPAANYNGPDAFSYKANDGTNDSNTVTVNITVTAVNDAPVAAADAYAMIQDNTLVLAAPGVLANDSDIDSGSLTVGTPRPVSGPAGGTLVLNADGSFSYTPVAGYSGVITFTYVANDGALNSTAAVVTITVGDGAYVSSSNWATSYSSSRYLALTFPAYVPAGSLVTGATFSQRYRSDISGDTTCTFFEVYSGVTLLATHGSAGSPISCNSSSSYVTDTVSLPEIDTVAEANSVTIKLYAWNSGGHRSVHQFATLGVVYSHD